MDQKNDADSVKWPGEGTATALTPLWVRSALGRDFTRPEISDMSQLYQLDGMSNSRHDSAFGNSGLMVTLQPGEFGSDHPLAGVELQRQFEAAAFELGRGNYLAPIQTAADFLRQQAPPASERLPSSYIRGTVPADLRNVLPPVVTEAIRNGLPVMDRRWRGNFLKNATLVGPDIRESAPVRIPRDRETYEVPGFAGLYPVGEGAGYAGGIISAAVDGLLASREVVRRYQYG